MQDYSNSDHGLIGQRSPLSLLTASVGWLLRIECNPLSTYYVVRFHIKELDAAFLKINYAADRAQLTAKAPAVDDGQLLNAPDHGLMSMPVYDEAILLCAQDPCEREIGFKLIARRVRVDAVHVILSHPVTQQERSSAGLERSCFRQLFEPTVRA